jgi:hypothetical protein
MTKTIWPVNPDLFYREISAETWWLLAMSEIKTPGARRGSIRRRKAGGSGMSEITVHDTVDREAIEAPHDRLIDTVTGTQQNALEGVEAARIALVEGAGLAQRAFAEFFAERLRQNLETRRALVHSRTLEEAGAVGFAHARTAFDQYGRELSRVLRLGTAMTRRSRARPGADA